jgi:succinate dehydrogenase / fumarate reductase cytochrome b subunit
MAPRKPAPLSPHLQIYRPQWTSVLSILHRLTGISLVIGLPFLTWFLWSINDHAAFETSLWFWGSPVGIFMLMGWAFAVSFHFLSGLRHLVFDTGRLFAIHQAESVGKGVVFCAVLLTLALWGCGLWGAFGL